MKIRQGFVSNSSTSSFICDICGEIEAGRDMCASDADMVTCENNHCFHEACAEQEGCELKHNEDPEKQDENDGDFNEDGDVLKSKCPFCTLKIIDSCVLKSYVYNKYTIDEKVIEREIRSKFKDEVELRKYINSSNEVKLNEDKAGVCK